jgi:methylenetetrahydrofolate reductase (NADPH)
MRNIRHPSGLGAPRVLRRPGPRADVAAGALADLLEQPRFEVLSTPRAADLVAAHLPPGRMVTVPASATRGLEPTLALSVELAGLGYEVVPHLAARMVTGPGQLAEIVARLQQAGITRVFVPSGDAPQAGAYPDAVALLDGLAELGSPFASVGITAYPESHPTIPDDLTIQAMWDKRRHATEMVSNLTFDPRVIETWLARVRRRGVTLPLWLGVPGPVDPTRLLAIASKIGVGDSTRFLLKHRRTMVRLAAPRGFDAESFLRRLAPTLASDASLVAGLHLFTFNQVAETEAWRTRLLARLREGGAHSRQTPKAL